MQAEKSNGNQITKQAVIRVSNADLVCFSHLRWDFVYQRPQHLMSRFAKDRRVFYIEEPRVGIPPFGRFQEQVQPNLWRLIPHLSDSPDAKQLRREHIDLIDQLFEEFQIEEPVIWYYTPMALDYSRQLKSALVVYDCMDELSAFNGAPEKLIPLENELFEDTHLVFTGGKSIYESKRKRHPNVHLFPSSIDLHHFKQARLPQTDPIDQKDVPHPRLGFFGVIDERFDVSLISAIATERPDWHLVMLGPVAKIEQDSLPKLPNIHYLGMKKYEELPHYLAGWDVALLPFAINRATQYISPTKTPEYLAGGKPVVSTPIRDVVDQYGKPGLVEIGRTSAEFISAIEKTLSKQDPSNWLKRVDQLLAMNSWDRTAELMKSLIQASMQNGNGQTSFSLSEQPFVEESIAMPLSTIKHDQQISVQKRSRNRKQESFDYLIVGAGFAGSVLAERLARGAGKRVLIIDCRPHIAGNAYDCFNDDGILIHKYGPHIFHTNSKEVFAYLSQFTRWRPYEHRVLCSVDGQLVPMPINLDTINRLYGLNLSAFELDNFFKSVAEPVEKITTSEDVVISRVGRDLYEKFFRNYTRKQWGLDPAELDSSVTSRVPVRLNRDDRYFTDVYQAMPLHGYTRMFENILDHPHISVMLNTDFQDIQDYVSYRDMVFTGPVDEYYNFRFGKLPYRSLEFNHQTLDKEFHQPVAVVNYPNEHAYTRVTEFKHLTGQIHPRTSLVYEYPCSDGDPYYPIPRTENAALYNRYKALAEREEGVHFAGRLGTYKYYNMDQVTAQALTLYARLTGQKRSEAASSYTAQRFQIEMPCPLLLFQDSES